MSELASSQNAPQESSNVSDFSQVFYIQIEIHKAEDLVKADLMGKSDPFCVVSAFGKNFQTKTVMKNLNPVWNEKTQFCFFNDPGELHFQVFDWDKGSKNDPIGDAKLSLNGFWEKDSKGFSGPLTLENVKKGKVYVSVRGKKLLPIQLENEAQRLQELNEEQLNKLKENESKISNLEASNKTLDENNNKKRIELDQLQEIKSTLEERIEELSNEQKEFENKINKLKETKKEKENELKESENKEKELQSEYNKLNGDLKDLNRENNELEQELKKLKTQLNDKNNTLNKLKQDLENEKNKPPPKKEEPKQTSPINNNNELTNNDNLENKNSSVSNTGDAPSGTKCCIIL